MKHVCLSSGCTSNKEYWDEYWKKRLTTSEWIEKRRSQGEKLNILRNSPLIVSTFSMESENSTYNHIKKLREHLKNSGSTDENPRIKAIVITKLQEAELFAKELYNEDA